VPPSDEDLVSQHLRGDLAAFPQLVERYTRPVYNLTFRVTGDRAEAENLTQEAFLRAYDALPRSPLERSFRAWLLRIALNLCRDWLKKKRPLAFADLIASAEAEDAPEDSWPDAGPTPGELLETRELAGAMRRAVLALPEAYRLVITLRYDEELSYEEIAELLHLPLNTVRTHLHRAKALLRRALEDWL
jgi:RNA polymerase sigma-70 factor (ECF subfamily)